MEDIRIHIHSFGPLKEIEFHLAPMMIFTGMSSLGKSYANYLAYYLMYSICGDGKLIEKIVAPKIESKAIRQSIILTTSEVTDELKKGVEPFMRRFLGDDLLACDVSFDIGGRKEYHFNYQKPSISEEQRLSASQDKYILFSYGDEELKYHRLYYGIETIISQCYREIVFGHSFQFAPILPPARGAFVGENYSVKSAVGSSVGMYDIFFRDYDRGVQNMGDNIFDERFFRSAIEKLLDGQLINEKGRQYLQITSGHIISLTAAASSIKELSPFLFYLKNNIGFSMSFCFEEPEAHLHPKMQVALADLVAACLNLNIFFQITTHSDYFLQRLNQLIKLETLKKKNEVKFKEICRQWNIDGHCSIDAKNVKAYYFHRNENGNVVIDDMPINEEGIPFRSFFEVANELQQREDEINDALYELSEKEGKE